MSDQQNREKGLEMFGRVYGDAVAYAMPEPGQDRFIDYMLSTVFGALWSSPILSLKERRLLLLGAIAAQGEDFTFSIQADAALKNGELTAAQLEEAVLMLTQYVGYPKASKMRLALSTVLKKNAEDQVTAGSQT